MNLPDAKQVDQLSPAALAYVGDAVYELYIRLHYLCPPRRISDYHHAVVRQVRAEQQAEYLRALRPVLTEQENAIARRGRNAVNRKPQRLNAQVYQDATSLETLIGYLYLKDFARLQELLTVLQFDER
ncbi:Mini-ribonuclease 3 [Spirulina sp. CS-785/01]|uniref:Mini-ribonuclease 3 n=1 Tax=Spirulina sp. CS-785/01 TaxID=3021716 RepID=UPI003FA68554